MNAWRHLLAVLLCPGVVAVIVPAIIVWRNGEPALVPGLLGAVLIGVGIALVAWTVTLFARVGRGTLAPWDPTSRLVVRGPYRHVRHPMITGVGCVLLGEAALVRSLPLLIWLAAFVAVNALYLPLVEEKGLSRRFGEEYERYKANVPRWLPRRRPWDAPD